MEPDLVKIAGTRDAWVVSTNTDLTEGRGHEYPAHICEKESTARRLARKAYVMGSDAPYSPTTLYKIGAQWYGPVRVITPTAEDDKNEVAAAAKRAALQKARAAGLTDDDLKDLLRTLA